ncbi:MAG: plastocyanin/azurin family copper-binding protein [Nitrospirota bacterium]|nr:plastocyanin/azurin family copper-binding protein [Nitrospirota bacterium]
MTQLKFPATLTLVALFSVWLTGCSTLGKGVGAVGGWIGIGDDEEETTPAAETAPMVETSPVAEPQSEPVETTPMEAAPEPELSLPPTEPVPFEEPREPMAAPPAPAEPQIYEVMVPEGAYMFVPRELTIYEGDTVVWKNGSGIVHLFASIPGADASGRMEIEPVDLLVDSDISHTFTVAGSYPYFCFIHNRMTGKINVLPR